MDTILGVSSETFEIFLKDLEEFLEAMKNEGVLLNLDKCRIAYEAIEFLGHKLGNDEVRPVNSNVEAIEKYPRPRTKAECQRFLGLVNYNRKFIPCVSQLLRPIIDLVKQERKFEWTVSRATTSVLHNSLRRSYTN